ncbi:MAG: hydroxymethylglutaryl-CoA lyase [Gammaproteobacteria bacterium]|nr:hydroxymethylglutaryl-CoA lyase [Gammaproteobacteria bacterium]
MSKILEIIEVSPRDGLQSEENIFSTEQKVALINRAIGIGIRRIEAVSFVHPKRVPQMADAEQVMALLPRIDGVSYIGLALNALGAERAVAAECDEINYVVLASETFSQNNQGASIAQTLETWDLVARIVAASGIKTTVTIGASFGCPFEGEIKPSTIESIVSRLMSGSRPPQEISLADTIGVAVPDNVESIFSAVHEQLPNLPLRAHFHNTRNTGYANALAASRAGVSALDSSLGGIGGCPFAPAATGNIATEDLIYLLDRSNIPTGIKLGEAIEASRWLNEQLHNDNPGLLARAGPFPSLQVELGEQHERR